jgi:hypothetical protein
MTEDEKVFSVIEAGSTIGVAANCYPDHQTPFLYGAAQTTSEDFFRKGGGYLVAANSSGTRALQNWASFAQEAGFLAAGQGKLGILDDECAPDPEMFDKTLKPMLTAMGVAFFEVRLSCDLQTQPQQVPAAILQMRQNGVDRVLLAVIFSTAQVFTQQAQAQQWKPKYSCSDLWGLCQTVFDKNFDPNQWDRVQGYTHSHTGEEAAGIPYNAAVLRCSQILEEAGLPAITDENGVDSAVVSLCDHFSLWLKVARSLPTNFTRADWVKGLEQLGSWDSAYSQLATFGPGKYDGGDGYATVEWHRECTCFHQIKPGQPARA